MTRLFRVFTASVIIAGVVGVIPAASFGQVQTQSMMLNTKHNLGATGPGPIKATGENQLCVFCHTPHVPSKFPSQQLWNHQLSAQEYTLYSSDYLTSLSYSAPNQPNPRSKLCLSCHDGTIAIGAVYNNSGSQAIEMQNSVTTLPADAAGNLGVSLANDHPVGYVYDNSRDPELVARPWPWNTAVKLDPDASGGTVECITCHDPHDNTYAPFLRISNTNASLCTFCHLKVGWTDAIHRTSTQNYTPPGGSSTTIGEWACRNCHESHGGQGVPYLLIGVEENTCFNSGCHGKSEKGVNTKDIQSEYEKLYAHPTITVTGKHKNPDSPTSLGFSNRHAECQDCHNSHRAMNGLHTIGSNVISGALLGTAGVIPGVTDNWTETATYTPATPSLQENQICLKCHSSYAFGIVPNGVTTIVGPSGVAATDQAMEFNPNNHSAHPVLVGLNSQAGSLIPKPLDPSQMTSNWNQTGLQSMYCSDCHGNDQPTSATVPQGPHASNSRFMLTGNAKYWPTNAMGSLWSLDDILNNKNNWQNDLFCSNCHVMYSGGTWTNNVHAGINHQDPTVKCITCHVTVPHGSKRSRLIGYATDVQPYNYLGIGVYDKLVITGFQKASGPKNYLENNCSMNGVCHGTQAGLYEQ